MQLLKYIPLFLFLIISIFLYNKIKFQKELEPLSSALIEKQFPKLAIYDLNKSSNINDFIVNRSVIINIFASWCAPCKQEHVVLKKFSKKYEILGVAYKDSAENINEFLEELGNPYRKVFFDYSGLESINLGLYGVPETFFVNEKGKILYKHVGPIQEKEFIRIVDMVFK